MKMIPIKMKIVSIEIIFISNEVLGIFRYYFYLTILLIN
jgi:hypothetical protein